MAKNKKPKLDPSAFHILPKSESGIEVKLELPDGTETGESILVRGADSKAFKKAYAVNNQKNMDLIRDSKKLGKEELAVKQQERAYRADRLACYFVVIRC